MLNGKLSRMSLQDGQAKPLTVPRRITVTGIRNVPLNHCSLASA